jgi:Uma2 family endonuclease
VAASNLGAELIGPYSRGRGGPGGWWVINEPELHFVRDTEILVPDLAGWRRERMPEIPRGQRFEVMPDWICEILSPSTRSKDREIKMPLYARYGVTHAWLVDPDAQTLEAYELRGAQWAQLAAYGADDRVAAAPFDAAAFRVGDLWS